MSRVALITGVGGQDGALLTNLLLKKGYIVYGTSRNCNPTNLWRLSELDLLPNINLIESKLNSFDEISKLVKQIQPDELYNLASQSSVSKSFEYPSETFAINATTVFHILEAVRLYSSNCRVYQASSSEMFGNPKELPITEESTLSPLSPYGTSKVAAHLCARSYRETFNVFVSCGILFNHESALRPTQFFVKKIVSEAVNVYLSEKDYFFVGDLNIRRDFGCAKKYVEAMWLMLQAEKSHDMVICSGQSISLKQIVDYVLSKLDLDSSVVKECDSLRRPSEIECNYGSNVKASEILGWRYSVNFESVLDEMIAWELMIRTKAQDTDH